MDSRSTNHCNDSRMMFDIWVNSIGEYRVTHAQISAEHLSVDHAPAGFIQHVCRVLASSSSQAMDLFVSNKNNTLAFEHSPEPLHDRALALIPDWAHEVFVAKGIGFEHNEVKEVVWEYFVCQFGEFECDQVTLKVYLAAVVGELIKKGDIEKARRFFVEQSSVEVAVQSQLAIFDEKVARFLSDT